MSFLAFSKNREHVNKEMTYVLSVSWIVQRFAGCTKKVWSRNPLYKQRLSEDHNAFFVTRPSPSQIYKYSLSSEILH